MRIRNVLLAALFCCALGATAKIKVQVKSVCPQTQYAALLLKGINGNYNISVVVADASKELPAEGFTLQRNGKNITVTGNDASGAIYGANKLLEIYRQKGSLESLTALADAPEMKLRGACVGLQKTVYLPGHRVYEYPYTPENFPWFYDKQLWIKYLDMLAANNMNAVYLWNGHPFASLVKLDDYPFAPEVDDATMDKNQEMFTFLTEEASRRGIRVIQMFYNILLSKPFADHYGLKTQDRNRPITPLISDYTRKSIAAFIQKYPNVGFLVCLGEAMATIDDDVEWMTKTIIPGIKDGLEASGRTDLPPIILRSHDTDGPLVLSKSLPLYPNIYTMSKYTGESLTTYEPRGPWAETHRQLASAAPIHISNVHILANLEPFRWSSPLFTQKTVQAMHNVHHANGLHLYPQASYWDWPYTADKIDESDKADKADKASNALKGSNGSNCLNSLNSPNAPTSQNRLLQIDRDWMWYSVWGRYSWNCQRTDEPTYWKKTLADYFGTDTITAASILEAYDESGEIAPKLLRRFGITEGNRQCLLLGMKVSQLVNPYKYTVYPEFYASCGPEGEKLIEYVEKRWKKEPHVGELPTDIIEQCVLHGKKAVAAIESVGNKVTRNVEEFNRLKNDMHCYNEFALSFYYKVLAAEQALNYKWTGDIEYLEKAVPLLEESGKIFDRLVNLTKGTYWYANSMQTSQRRIPVGGDDGKFKTWEEMVPVYAEELAALKENIVKLRKHAAGETTADKDVKKANDCLANASVKLISPYQTMKMEKGVKLFENRDEAIESVAAEFEGMTALVLNRDTTRINGGDVEFECDKPIKMLVGFFVDDQNKFASPPKLEIDATGNEYGQAEPIVTNAISMKGMPIANIHAYHLSAGHHHIYLPKGIIMVAGFTDSDLKSRDAGLNGASGEVDWLFMR